MLHENVNSAGEHRVGIISYTKPLKASFLTVSQDADRAHIR